jgi:catechol 2,3-dioxygenase-like lactoylglutathione lyase family enzyme
VLASSPLVAFVATADPEQAKRFYGELLGLPLIDETPFACVFQTANAVLRIAIAPDIAPAPYTVLGWTVEDIAAMIGDLSRRGVEFLRYEGIEQDELGVWRSPSGARVAWFHDPDGNLLSLTQP